MAGIKTIVEAAELIAEVRSAFAKIESLQEAQKQMMSVIESQDKRLRELEASVREVRSEVKFEALKETQNIVNAVQGQIYNEIKSLSIAVDRMERGNIPESTAEAHEIDGSEHQPAKRIANS